jgi:hypothetical protein
LGHRSARGACASRPGEGLVESGRRQGGWSCDGSHHCLLSAWTLGSAGRLFRRQGAGEETRSISGRAKFTPPLLIGPTNVCRVFNREFG